VAAVSLKESWNGGGSVGTGLAAVAMESQRKQKFAK
jgi:hypothetical protein